jgi:isoaspartyl peptidase/L-asparaginase-like protein (Ntn-hydrolase superfamily)
MTNRRKFIQKLAIGSSAFSLGKLSDISPFSLRGGKRSPIIISTWNNHKANKAAWSVIEDGGHAIDAVETGVKVPEADPDDQSVGFGGRPDRHGKVTLDSCIMDETGRCGSVAFLEHIKHPISVARLVMEKTPHVMLAGEGALEFALSQGFKKESLLTKKSRAAWKKWKKDQKYKPVINIENHDTIGMLALDQKGHLSGACTTSGAAFKMRGRVGDSPIIGAGLFVDNEVGAATATGLGEAVIRVCGTHLVVELMRLGHSPQKACELAVKRVISKNPDYKDLQVGFIAINNQGNYGGYAIQPGFVYYVTQDGKGKLVESGSYL